MKKYIALLLAMVMIFSMAGCKKGETPEKEAPEGSTKEVVADDSMKIGYILPAESGAPDTEVREDAIRKTQFQVGLDDNQIMISENVNKETCEEKIKEQIKKGCTLIFACGARYEDVVLALAEEHDDVQFCIEGGKASIKSALPNIHTFNSKIYEAYYAAGVAAGKEINYRLNRGDVVPSECTIGFVAYKECAETTTCINAFYQGVKVSNSQCNIAVRYVGKRGNYDADGEAARQLEAQGVCMLANYTYTTAVGAVAAENGTAVFGSEDNIIFVAPKKAITSTYTDWSVYYTEALQDLIAGREIPKDWCGGYQEGAVRLTQINDSHIADGISAALIEVEQDLRKGKAKIFDLGKFTVDGSNFGNLVKENSDYKKYKKYIKNGQFKEQSISSSPAFDILIDGISVSTGNYITQPESDSAEEEQ